jgi:hypothetical protein
VDLFDAWGEKTPHTQIVAIGAFGSNPPEALKIQFDACIKKITMRPMIERIGNISI